MPSELLLGCALKRETDSLRQHFGDRYQYITTGLGFRKSGTFLEQYFHQYRPRLLVFTGTAGQLDPELEMGQAVLPEAWRLEEGPEVPSDVSAVSLARSQGWTVPKLGLTVKTPIIRKKKRVEFFQRFGTSVCDMESAAVLQVAIDSGVPAMAVKVVADTAESGLSGFWRHFDANMAELARRLESLLPEL